MKSQRLLINGIRHQIYFWGSPKKPLIIFLHGWLDTGASFDFTCRHLEHDFHCIAPDMRGYGQSAHSKSPLGYFFYEYIADLHALATRLSPQKPVILAGHSLGGNVASFYAGAYPDRVSYLINIEGFGFQEKKIEDTPVRLRTWLEGIRQRPHFRIYKTISEFADRLRKANPRLPQDRALFIARHITKKTKGGVIMAADPMHKLPEPYFLDTQIAQVFWGNIKAPCLLITAECSELLSYLGNEDLQTRLSHFPNASKKAAIRDCGHMVHYEQAEDLAKIIIQFIIDPMPS